MIIIEELFDDPLTFHLAPSTGHKYYLCNTLIHEQILRFTLDDLKYQNKYKPSQQKKTSEMCIHL